MAKLIREEARIEAFAILQTARNDGADMILMGYPEERPGLTQSIEYKSPCDVVFTTGFDRVDGASLETVTLGAGGGPHHRGSLSMVRPLAERGAEIHIVSVAPSGGDIAEDPAGTAAAFEGLDFDVRTIEAPTIADGLVEAATEEGGVLVIGASRDRRWSQWVFGSTPDSVVDHAAEANVPVLVYAATSGVPERIEDYVFPIYRYLRRRLQRTDSVDIRQ